MNRSRLISVGLSLFGGLFAFWLLREHPHAFWRTLSGVLIGALSAAHFLSKLVPDRLPEHRSVVFYSLLPLAAGVILPVLGTKEMLILGVFLAVLGAISLVQLHYITAPPESINWKYPYLNPEFEVWRRSLPPFARGGAAKRGPSLFDVLEHREEIYD